jgi:glucans biosynthesis protein
MQGNAPLSSVRRRDVLAGFSATVAFAALGGPSTAQQLSPQAFIQSRLGDGRSFDANVVADIARQLSRQPFVAPPNDLPGSLANLNFEQYTAIKPRQPFMIWGGDGRGIALEPLHRGFVFNNAVDLYTVEDGAIRRLGYDASRFDFGGLNIPANIGDIGFSGFRLLSIVDGPPTDFAIFQGATFFRALARGQNFGAIARALTLRPADSRGEEFPFFRAFWLERPAAGSNSITIHALIDSESTTGSTRMTLRPGDMTIIDVETTLYPRVELQHVGLGGMGSTYLFGPNDRRNADDIRASVYESSGLQMYNGKGEWLWRPLHNPETLQISAFVDEAPKGFGLLQRERAYESFHDDNQRFDRRPSLWIEPLGNWTQGSVQLLEIPTDSELNDNILAYWRPKAPMAAGSEVSFAYRQYWCWTPPERPPMAIVTGTRSGGGTAERRRRFLVDFSGDILATTPAADIKPIVNVGPGSTRYLRLWSYPERKTVRIAFELDPGNENASEMRLILEAGGKQISETWLYRWTP